ncbi:sporulation protein [Ectobacillus panaciterrae]|uniref:sporulation protein n=1 Tax=Ectobacillus panaciterrae TaxID=363872 RepID=UPI00040DF5A8|nr:sporulation protein [Ectobacillus panaciterrae]
MLKKFLARLGKGAATVDLRFENRPYRAGETVQGEVILQGGEAEQNINHVSVRLIMSLAAKEGTVMREVTAISLSGALIIRPKEQRVIPFTYTIPVSLPLSRGTVSYYFDTHLDIEAGVDRTDVDPLIIEAPQEVQAVFQALESIGFREKPRSGKLDKYGQEFSFFPAHAFTGHVNELELRFAYEESGLRIWLEVDCPSTFGEAEAKRELFVEHEVLQNKEKLKGLLYQTITETVQQPHAYTNPFSYTSHHSHQGSLTGMIGGLAVGIVGGMLLGELFEEAMEGAAGALGFDEETFGGDDESGFGDFFGGDDEF